MVRESAPRSEPSAKVRGADMNKLWGKQEGNHSGKLYKRHPCPFRTGLAFCIISLSLPPLPIEENCEEKEKEQAEIVVSDTNHLTGNQVRVNTSPQVPSDLNWLTRIHSK